jgi:hypothetical protein
MNACLDTGCQLFGCFLCQYCGFLQNFPWITVGLLWKKATLLFKICSALNYWITNSFFRIMLAPLKNAQSGRREFLAPAPHATRHAAPWYSEVQTCKKVKNQCTDPRGGTAPSPASRRRRLRGYGFQPAFINVCGAQQNRPRGRFFIRHSFWGCVLEVFQKSI